MCISIILVHTYVWTAEGWLYLAALKDLCCKQVVGYSLSEQMTAQLVCNVCVRILVITYFMVESFFTTSTPTSRGDCGFCPVIIRSSTTTYDVNGKNPSEYFEPLDFS